MILIKDIVLALSGSQYTRKEKSIRHLYCENLLKKKKKIHWGVAIEIQERSI